MKNLKYFLLAFLLAVIAIGGCNNSTSPSSSGPVIKSFTATPSTITNGNSTILKWSLDGTQTSVSLDNGLGDQTSNSSDSLVVNPSVTTTYTLTAKNASGTSTQAVTVIVNGTSHPTTLVVYFALTTDFATYLAPINASGVPYDELYGTDGRQFGIDQIKNYARVVLIQGDLVFNAGQISTFTQYLDMGNKKLAIISDAYDNFGAGTLGDVNHANIGASYIPINNLKPQFNGQGGTTFSGLSFTGLAAPKNGYVETVTLNPGSVSKAAIIGTDTLSGSPVITAIQSTFLDGFTFLYTGMEINLIDASHQNAYMKAIMSF